MMSKSSFEAKTPKAASFHSQFVDRSQEPPPPVLVRKRPHVLEPGMLCEHMFSEERWTIDSVSGFWCRAHQGRLNADGSPGSDDCSQQCFPCDVLLPVVHLEKTKAGVSVALGKTRAPRAPSAAGAAKPPRAPREVKPLDDVAQLLAECGSLDDLWKMAVKQGLPKDLRKKLEHLNPGLQRMNIGNRIRNLRKKAKKG